MRTDGFGSDTADNHVTSKKTTTKLIEELEAL